MNTTSQPTASSTSAQPACLPPVVVLPDPDAWPPRFVPPQVLQRAAAEAAAALGAVAAYDTHPARDGSLHTAHARVRALHEMAVQNCAPLSGDDVDPASPIQSYFRIRRATLTGEQAAVQAVGVLAWCLGDLRQAPLAGSDVERCCAAMQQCLHDLYTLPHRDATLADPSIRVDAPIRDDEVISTPAPCETLWYIRWMVGHHVHALLNVLAAAAIDQAIDAANTAGPDAAVTHLRRATVYVDGFPGARAQSLALPAAFYNQVLRPSMLPPLVPVPLSGKMHVEYQRYQAGVDAFMSTCSEPIDVLATQNPTLALAREALLEADLTDAQRHALLVEPLVGAAKSLVQHTRAKDNAVSVLRRIYARRASRYAPFVRFSAEPAVTPTP